MFDYAKLEPFFKRLFNEVKVGLRNFALFLIHQIIVFEVYFVFKICGKPEVIFINTDGFLVFMEHIYIFLSVFTGHI